jgi:hypothetical protein
MLASLPSSPLFAAWETQASTVLDLPRGDIIEWVSALVDAGPRGMTVPAATSSMRWCARCARHSDPNAIAFRRSPRRDIAMAAPPHPLNRGGPWTDRCAVGKAFIAPRRRA